VKQFDPNQLLFVDENVAPTIGLTPLRARTPKGKRAIGRAPRNRAKNTTLIAALSSEGMGAAMSSRGLPTGKPLRSTSSTFSLLRG